MNLFEKIFSKIKKLYYYGNDNRMIQYLRKQGVLIGENVVIRHPMSSRIDLSRPSLIEIGDNVDINKDFQLLTHDWCSFVFRNVYHDFINSSGKVVIGNNVYIASNVTILKGVTIGNNVIIGAHSLVTKNIPSNSVAAGVPCRVICSLEDYYLKRKNAALDEAKEYVQSIRQRFGREPQLQEMSEEFIYFVNKKNLADYKDILPIQSQLDLGYHDWIENHKSLYDSFDEFLASIK